MLSQAAWDRGSLKGGGWARRDSRLAAGLGGGCNGVPHCPALSPPTPDLSPCGLAPSCWHPRQISGATSGGTTAPKHRRGYLPLVARLSGGVIMYRSLVPNLASRCRIRAQPHPRLAHSGSFGCASMLVSHPRIRPQLVQAFAALGGGRPPKGCVKLTGPALPIAGVVPTSQRRNVACFPPNQPISLAPATLNN